jgi:hypothetical protein
LDVQEKSLNHQILEVEPADFVAEEWSEKSLESFGWSEMNRKGGYFEYELKSIAKLNRVICSWSCEKLFAKRPRRSLAQNRFRFYMLKTVALIRHKTKLPTDDDSYLTCGY